MRKYRQSAATSIRLDYGIDLAAGLGMFPETAPFATPLTELNDKLEQAFETRRGARKPLVVARAKVRVANYLADTAIRSFSRACEVADGGRRGPIHAALFPDGLAVVVAPVGSQQVAPLQALLGRVESSQLAGVGAVRTEWQPKLAAALDALTKGTSAYDAAKAAYVDAFGKELALRDAHFVAIDSIMGHVHALFPRDRTKQDAIFPEVDDGHGASGAEGEAEETAAQGG